MGDPLHAFLSRRTEARFEHLVRATFHSVLRAAMRVLHDQPAAEDIAQELYLGLLRAPPDWGTVRHGPAWLAARAVGLARTQQRSTSRRAAREREGGASEMGRKQSSLEDTEAVRVAVDALPDDQRACGPT